MNEVTGDLALVNATPEPPETLGALIRGLERVESAFRSNSEAASRMERLRGRPAKEYALVDVLRKEGLDAIGRGLGVQEIRVLCDLEKLDFTAAGVRSLRALLCLWNGLTQDSADRLTPGEAAARLKDTLLRRSEEPPNSPRRRRIPAEDRTRPLGIGEAARLMGYARGRSAKDAGKMLRAAIDDGAICCEKLGRQQYIFSRRDFPKAVWPKLAPTGPNRP
jgi:hypothetical protein